MRIPRVRLLRSKLSSAMLLGKVLKNSLQFKLRRSALPRFKGKEFDTIIVDMDGTLYRSDANLEALMLAYPEISEAGKTNGEEIYDSILSKIASGEYSIEQAIVEGNKFLVAKKVSKSDFPKIIGRLDPVMRKNLIKALKDLKQAGKTLVLATLSSREFGGALNDFIHEKFGFRFDFVLGTEMQYSESGEILGVKNIVGTKDFDLGGIPVKSKLSTIKDAMASAGKEFDVKKAVLITDSYGDIDLAKMLVTILIKPHNATTAQKVSYRLRLADYILPDNRDLKQNLESIILGPEK